MIPFKHTRNGALTIKGDVIILNANTATKSDYPLILKIWEASVRKTRHFLKESDLLFYKEIIPQALDSVNLIVWKNQNHEVVGFSGIDKDELVMLFLDPQFIDQGYGREILSTLVRKYDIKRIDVNSQNVQAKRFYLKNNFKIDSEDPVDGFGKPYPITHLIRSI